MQETSTLYKRLITSAGHWFECALTIGDTGNLITENSERLTFGVVGILIKTVGGDSGYRENTLISMSTSNSVFSDNPSVGCCVSGEIEVKLIKPTGNISRMESLCPFVRVTNGTEHSEWLSKGKYFIDTRSVSLEDGLEVLTLHGYDSMLKTEQLYPDSATKESTVLDTVMVSTIAELIGCSVYTENMDKSYKFTAITGLYSCREILSMIASAYCGNFIIDDTNTLRLVKLTDLFSTDEYIITDNYGYRLKFGDDRIKWSS